MEPIWDWNLSFGNANYHQGWTTDNWYWPLLRENEVSWFRRLRQDPEFVQRLTDRWAELRRTVLIPENILKRVDELASQLGEAQERNFQRWPVLGQFVNPNWYVGGSYEDEVTWMKSWIQERIGWIDSQFLPPPALSRKEAPGKSSVQVSMQASTGTVFYTLDGSDPRLPGGDVSPKAHEYGDPMALNPGTKVFARTRTDGSWSGPAIGTVPNKTPAGQ
jgi:CotH kinase protein/Fn3 associated